MSSPLEIIHDFVQSWSLLGTGWMAGWCLAVALAIPGVLVVAREQSFIGVAIGQASTCGVAIGLWIAGWLAQVGGPMDPCAAAQSSGMLRIVPVSAAVLAAIVAAIATTVGAQRDRRSSPESRTVWIFLAGAAGTTLLLMHSAHGTRGIERLMTSSLLGADPVEAGLCAVLAFGGILFAWWRHRTLVLLAIDPASAPLAGLHRRTWELGLAIWLGFTIGVGIRVGGLLYAAGCLVLPALAARQWCRELRWQFLVAPLIALGLAVPAFVVANHLDWYPAQLAIAGGCLVAAASALLTWRRS